MISANTRNLIQAISIDGNVADRYFDVTSEVPRNTVEARISAMPRNGRSARAAGRTDFFSGSGKTTRSSLAAAAGGGVNGLSPGDGNEMNESGEGTQNDKAARSTRTEIRQPICAIARGALSLPAIAQF